MRHTVRGIIIRDKKILLVTGHGADFYWTPGGGVEQGETVIEALRREIKEELGATIINYKPYHSYDYEDQRVDNFIIDITGDIVVGEEITGTTWYDSQTPGITASKGFTRTLKPRLIKDGLIN